MAVELQQILRNIEHLTPDELLQVRRKLDEINAQRPSLEDEFGRKLREMGIVTRPRLPRDPNRTINPTPIIIAGEPVSQTLIRERR